MEPSTGTSMALVCTKKSPSSGMQRRIGKCFFTLLSTIYSLILFLCGWLMSIMFSCHVMLRMSVTVLLELTLTIIVHRKLSFRSLCCVIAPAANQVN